MRAGYTSISAGVTSASYALDERDLRRILAEHFGLDPETVDLGGLEMPDGELTVTGRSPEPAAGPRR